MYAAQHHDGAGLCAVSTLAPVIYPCVCVCLWVPLQSGVSIIARDANGRTLLHYTALPYGELRTTELTAALAFLLRWPCDSVTAPASASASASVDSKADVCMERCDLLARDCEGDTALHLMARNGQQQLVPLLVRCAEERGVLHALLRSRNRVPVWARPIDLATAPETQKTLLAAYERCFPTFDRVFEGSAPPLPPKLSELITPRQRFHLLQTNRKGASKARAN
jgi:hypothetical protein